MIGRRTRRWLPALLLATTPALADVASILHRCTETADPDVGAHATLAESCPDAVAAVEALALAGVLPEDWRDTLTIQGTRQIQFLESFYAGDRGDAARIDASALDTIVAGLDNPTRVNEEKSLWQRFTDWLDEVFGDSDEQAPGWLDDWLSGIEISERWLTFTFYLLSGLIIIGAVAVIVIELGASRRARRAATGDGLQPSTATGAAGAVTRPTRADLDRAAPQDRPGILLAVIRQKLEQLSLLPYRRAATHRELALGAKSLPAGQHEAFNEVARSAERIRFGEALLDTSEIDRTVATGLSLLERLGRS